LKMEEIVRVVVMLDKVKNNESTDEIFDLEIDNAAMAVCHRINEFLGHLKGSSREEFASAMGWDSADSLQKFIEHGRLESWEKN